MNPFQNVGGRIIVLMTSFGNGVPDDSIENQSPTSKHRFILYFMVKGFLIFQFFFKFRSGGFSGVLIPNINLKLSISITGGR